MPSPCGGGSFFGISSPAVNNQGKVAFVAGISPSYRDGVFVVSETDVRKLVSAGDPAPDGDMFERFASLSFNDAGQLAFYALLAPSATSGIFLWSEDGVQTIARTGDPAPGGGTFTFPAYLDLGSAPSLNGSGQVAFGAPLSTGRSGIFAFSGGALSSLARPGDPAPGGGTFDFAEAASLNDAGQVSFHGSGSEHAWGSFLYSGGQISVIAQSGTPAPGGDTFVQTVYPKLNAQTRVAFAGYFSGEIGAFLATPVT